MKSMNNLVHIFEHPYMSTLMNMTNISESGSETIEGFIDTSWAGINFGPSHSDVDVQGDKAYCSTFSNVNLSCGDGQTLQTLINNDYSKPNYCAGKVCTEQDKKTCCTAEAKCIGATTPHYAHYETHKLGDWIGAYVENATGKLACTANENETIKPYSQAIPKTQGCCTKKAQCNTMTNQQCTAPQFGVSKYIFNQNAYCAGTSCSYNDKNVQTGTCCVPKQQGASCATKKDEPNFCDNTSHVLNKQATCKGSPCTNEDKSVCCVEKDKCSSFKDGTLNCSNGREYDKDKADVYCFGKLCNTIDDSDKCCKIQSTNAKCGGDDQDINFAIWDNEYNEGYLRWGDDPCDDGGDPKVFKENNYCASNVCTKNDFDTCCVKRALCTTYKGMATLCGNDSLYFIQDTKNSYCQGEECGTSDVDYCCETYDDTTLTGYPKEGSCGKDKTNNKDLTFYTWNADGVGTKINPCKDCTVCDFRTEVMIQDCTATSDRKCVTRCDPGNYYDIGLKTCKKCIPACSAGKKETSSCSAITPRTCVPVPPSSCDEGHTWSTSGNKPCEECTVCETQGGNKITDQKCTKTSNRTCKIKLLKKPKDDLVPVPNPTGDVADNKLSTEQPTPSVDGLIGCNYRNDGAIYQGKARIRWDNPNVTNGTFRGTPVHTQQKWETLSWDQNCKNYATDSYNTCVNPAGSFFGVCSWYGPIPTKSPQELKEEKIYLKEKQNLNGCKTRDDGGHGVHRFGNSKASGDWAKKSSTEAWDKHCESAKQSECPRWGAHPGAPSDATYASGGTNTYSRCSWYCGPDTAQQNCPVDDNDAIYDWVQWKRDKEEADKKAKEEAKAKKAGTSYSDGYRCTSLQGYPWTIRCPTGWNSTRQKQCGGCPIVPQNKIECKKVVPSICKWKKTV